MDDNNLSNEEQQNNPANSGASNQSATRRPGPGRPAGPASGSGAPKEKKKRAAAASDEGVVYVLGAPEGEANLDGDVINLAEAISSLSQATMAAWKQKRKLYRVQRREMTLKEIATERGISIEAELA